MTRSRQGTRLRVWQKTGDVYVVNLGAAFVDEAPFMLRSGEGDILDGVLRNGRVEATIDCPSRNIRGRLVLVERGATADALAQYEGLWREGLLGPESFQQLAIDAAERRDVSGGLTWLQRGRQARRPLNDALAYSSSALDLLRQDPRFREIIGDPVAAHPELSQQRYRVRIDRGVRMVMRDGVSLLADIYRPDVRGRFPVILIRTPYGRGADIPPEGVDHFAPRGYVVVIQSVRGRDGSEGRFEPWLNERRDGFDSVDWASRQSWSDGGVGMMGLSYLGQAQWQAAVEAHPALKAIIPEVSGTDSFLDTPYDHGILRLDLLQWARGMFPPARQRTLPPADDSVLTRLPLSALDQAYVGEPMAIWQQVLRLDTGDQWAASNFLADLKNVHIPALNISGWWDAEANSTMRNFRTMRDLGRSNQWLIYGPWQHVWNQPSSFQDQDYGPSAIIDFKSLAVRWFDQWLKQKPVSFESAPTAQIFVTGANEWRGFADWPAPGAERLEFHLSSGAGGCERDRTGMLGQTPRDCAPRQYVYDPMAVSTEGPGVFQANSTILDLDPAAGNSLIYETAPFERAVTLAAPASLELSFATTGRDVDFFVLVFDRDETGVARALSGPGKMRMSFRDGWSRPALLEPGQIYRGAIELRPFAHLFRPGHRLGILIRSEWFPGYARNLNTGEPIADATRVEAAHITIFGDRQNSSVVRLWSVPDL